MANEQSWLLGPVKPVREASPHLGERPPGSPSPWGSHEVCTAETRKVSWPHACLVCQRELPIFLPGLTVEDTGG